MHTAVTERPAAPAEELLTRSDSAGIATLTMNRPDKFNALSVELLDALLSEFQAIGEDRSVRVVVLAAAGRAFCTGHDLKQMRADPGEEAIRVRPMCYVTLTIDHRVLDGFSANKFLTTWVETIESWK